MSVRSVRLLLPVVLIAANLACDPEEDDPPTPSEPPVPEFDPLVDSPQQLDDQRVVGRLPETGLDCPPPENQDWSVRPMFPGGGGDLDRYCVYERNGGPPEEGPFSSVRPQTGLIALPDGMTVAYDRVVLAPQSSQPAMAANFQERFSDMAGALDWLQSPSEMPARTRLALIDSSPDLAMPDVFTTPGDGDHGFLLAHLVRELACVGSLADRCLVDLRTRNALRFGTPPWPVGTPTDPPEALQGSWGTIGMLAEAVYAELRAWEETGREQPLVINLSVAWHPYFDGGITDGIEILEDGATDVDGRNNEPTRWDYGKFQPDTWAKDVHAVWDVLAEARCRGALVVAASGNRTGGEQGESGPMLPAGWAGVPLDRLPACADVDGTPPDWSSAPLVYAVGGVGENLRDLSVSRPRSRAPLMAFGDHAVSDRGIANDDAPLTGTSVSNVIVSTTAAMLLNQAPELTPREVMETIYAASSPIGQPVQGPYLDTPAEVFGAAFDPTADAARLVRMCEVLRSADAAWVCAATSPTAVSAPIAVSGGAVGAGDLTKALAVPLCGVDVFARYASVDPWPATSTLCPDRQHYGAQIVPWTYPQPQSSECPFCFVDTELGRLYLEFDRDLAWFDALTVTMITGAEQQHHYTLPNGLLSANTSLDLNFDPSVLPANVVSARLTMVKNDTSVQTGLTLKTAP
jgi:hypothetical protein